MPPKAKKGQANEKKAEDERDEPLQAVVGLAACYGAVCSRILLMDV
jgi:hypothetical protein